MTELEVEHQMPAAAEAVFAVVSDLDRLPQWLPAAVDVHPSDDGTAHARVPARDVEAEGLVRVRPEQLRVEWGSEGSPDYAGWLQVMHGGPERSSVVLHLSFLGNQPETHGGRAPEEVRGWPNESLTRLQQLVTQID